MKKVDKGLSVECSTGLLHQSILRLICFPLSVCGKFSPGFAPAVTYRIRLRNNVTAQRTVIWDVTLCHSVIYRLPSETSVQFYQTTWRYNRRDNTRLVTAYGNPCTLKKRLES